MSRIALLFAAGLAVAQPRINSIGMELVPIPAGRFTMGETAYLSEDLVAPLGYYTRKDLKARYPWGDVERFRYHFDYARRGDFDERPAHEAEISKPFFIGSREVTNAQYEQFDPAHKAQRGKKGFSKLDNEAVIFVSWNEAKAFCDWLSKKEGVPYRLPTEAEWEYAARAGTRTPYWTGNELPAPFLSNARPTEWTEPHDIVSLETGRTPANPWGLHDVHGNVEEWTLDWYGPYSATPQRDPSGHVRGDFRVVRGGSHGTPAYYLRSANRMGALPETRGWLTGFRVVQAAMPTTAPIAAPAAQPAAAAVRPKPAPQGPYFSGPRRYVHIPAGQHGPLYAYHNHDGAIAECPNGDMLAIWYSCEQERGRELEVAASRLRPGAAAWSKAEPFWDAPDRNDHCPALWFDGLDTLYHINGYGIAGRWTPLAIILRTSKDSGRTWSPARLIEPEFGFRTMVGQPVFRTSDGAIVFQSDAQGNSTVYVSRDNGATWKDMGGNIPGVHAATAQLRDGRLIAFGRNANIEGWMPKSLSRDLGQSWQSGPSAFPPVNGGQRSTMIRLREGPLLFLSFAASIDPFQPVPPGERPPREKSGIYAALSYDDGQTWPKRRWISDGREHGFETFDGGWIRMAADRSEPQGYLAATQARNGIVHLISSVNHYEFNLAWLEQPQTPAKPLRAAGLPVKATLPKRVNARFATNDSHWTNERSGEFEAVDPRRGFTIEIEAAGPFEVEAFAASGPLIATRYVLKVATAGRYRIAVRADTVAEIYRDGELVEVREAEIVIGRGQPLRGPYVNWSPARDLAIGFDDSGAYRPGGAGLAGERK